MALSRRRFLAAAAGGAGAAALGAGAWSRLVGEQVERAADRTATTTGAEPDGRRVLVVVQCDGGNDGLNTIVPTADGRYRDLRPGLAVPEDQLIEVTGLDGYALHPALAPLVPWWDRGRLAMIEGIGFEGQSRSHFEAMDLWWSATPGEPSTTGWLGRWNDLTATTEDPLRVVTLGARSEAVTGDTTMATRVNDPAAFRLATPRGVAPEEITAAFLATAEPVGPPALEDLQRAIPAAIDAVDLVAAATPALGPGAQDEPLAPSATSLLETAAGLIGLDVGTRVVVVGIGGFDTHAGQAERHPELLADVATGIARLLELVEGHGRAEDVLVVTTSEFGRRAAENGSAGTDHGNAGVLLACGSPVRGGRVGETRLDALVEGDVPIDVDTRSLYAVALDWLGGPTDDVLGGSFDRYGLLDT